MRIERRAQEPARRAIGAEAVSASIAQVWEALSEGLLFPCQNPNKRPEFAETPAIGGGALTTGATCDRAGSVTSENIKRKNANVYLTHTASKNRYSFLSFCEIGRAHV